jgi:catechol 2,3-dioxygenase
LPGFATFIYPPLADGRIQHSFDAANLTSPRNMGTTLQLESIHLRVPDVARSLDFYRRRLGFTVLHSASTNAELSVAPGAPPLLYLSKTHNASAPADAAGLFHAALLLPNRAALASWLRFAAENGIQFQGFSDHGVSEAIYCSDADGNGLEFYADRPQTSWPFVNGELAMDTRPLDVEDLLAESPPTGVSVLDGARWGHLHLRVTNLEQSETFYRTALGMEVTQKSYPGARFLAADGYHHHLGLNTWGNPRRPQPADAPGLADATFSVAGIATESRLRDPDGIALHLRPISATAVV